VPVRLSIYQFLLFIELLYNVLFFHKGIGLLVFPVIISDFILLHLTKKRKLYRELKIYDYKKMREQNDQSNDTSLNDDCVRI